MAVRRPDLVNHNLRAFGHEVRLNESSGGVSPVVADVQSITMGYGIEENRCYFTMWDPASMVHPAINVASQPIPRLSDDVRITAKDGSNMSGPSVTIFRGKIDGVTEQLTPQGKQYNCTAVSNIARLNESCVTMLCNVFNDPNHPNPVFDPVTGVTMKTKPQTVVDVIGQIMNFQDAWSSTQYFTYGMIDWNDDLDTSLACGLFVPMDISYHDQPKGRAIQEILSRAGNFHLMYDPETDRLKIIELNLDCNRCGDRWPIAFATPVAGGAGEGMDYANVIDVKEDTTEWSTHESANVVRISSSRIRFYTGDYIIPEMIENRVTSTGAAVSEANRLRAVGKDTVALQQSRAINQDGVYYRFQAPEKVWEDHRKYQQYPVGMPLFPDWNVFADFLPDIVSIPGVIPLSNIPTAFAATVSAGPPPVAADQNYLTKVEYQPVSRGQQIAMGLRNLGYPNNLRVYQAWYVKEKCPACNGFGNVKAIYSGAGNMPVITWDVVASGKRPVPKVTNYIFDPTHFGAINPATKLRYPPTGLEPFSASMGGDPVPWKNLCPYCRGVGWQPEYKIRNFQGDLFTGRTTKLIPDGAPAEAAEVMLDPEFTQTTPETWEESQSRHVVSWGAAVQLEHGFVSHTYRVPAANQNATWAEIKAVTPPAPYTTDHPLKGFEKLLAAPLAVAAADKPLVPDTSDYNSVHKIFTSIQFGNSVPGYRIEGQMGRVIFTQPVFIECMARFGTMRVTNTGGVARYNILPNGLIDTTDLLNGAPLTDSSRKPLAYWRPARAWLQGFYTKEHFYWRPPVGDPNHDPIEFTYTTPDGDVATYIAKAMIMDGRWTCEVYKKGHAEGLFAGGASLAYGYLDRPVMATMTDDQSKVETTEEDLRLMLVPPNANYTFQQLEDYKNSLTGFKYARGHAFRWEQPTPGEVLYEMEGLTTAQASQAFARPRLYSWRLRDDRPKLLAMAVRRLELVNDLQVRGALTLKGMLNSTLYGLGWVYYPGRGNATVMKVTHNFSAGFSTTLELTRTEARYGEMPPDDKVDAISLQRQFSALKLAVEKRNEAGAMIVNADVQYSGGNNNSF